MRFQKLISLKGARTTLKARADKNWDYRSWSPGGGAASAGDTLQSRAREGGILWFSLFPTSQPFSENLLLAEIA